MDVQKKLDEIAAAVSAARSMPMSASCVINRAELLGMLDEVRAVLPESLSEAEALIGGRDRMVEEAHAEARRILEQAHAERASLVCDTGVVRQSQAEAERILAEARQEAAEIRAEADDYVDSKLANFEVVLTKTIGSVDRGREKLLGLGQGPGQGADDGGYPDEDAPERSADPDTLRRRADDYVDAKLGAFEAVLSKTLEAVGRGRLKLVGHRPAHELGAHLAAQDAVGAAAVSAGVAGQSDDEYLAGLAAAAAPGDYQYDRAREQLLQQQAAGPQPQAGGYAYPSPDPYGQQPVYADPYAAQQPVQQPAVQQAAYYDPNYGWQQQAEPPAQQPYVPQPAAALDETSFFDTGMIDLDRLRELEQGR